MNSISFAPHKGWPEWSSAIFHDISGIPYIKQISLHDKFPQCTQLCNWLTDEAYFFFFWLMIIITSIRIVLRILTEKWNRVPGLDAGGCEKRVEWGEEQCLENLSLLLWLLSVGRNPGQSRLSCSYWTVLAPQMRMRNKNKDGGGERGTIVTVFLCFYSWADFGLWVSYIWAGTWTQVLWLVSGAHILTTVLGLRLEQEHIRPLLLYFYCRGSRTCAYIDPWVCHIIRDGHC